MSIATVTSLRRRHGDHLAHSDHVSDLATTIFTETLEVHGVSPRYVPLLQAGSLLHNVGLAEDATLHHVRGRDIVALEGLRGYSDEERAAVACLVMFHRKRVRPDDEPLFQSLGKDLRAVTLRLAAILRVADGLDYCGTHLAQIARVSGRNRATVSITGNYDDVGVDVARANKKADLWREVVGTPLRVETTERSVALLRPPALPGDTLAEAGGIALRVYCAHMTAAISGAGTFAGITARHDARVAIRRFRAVLRMNRRIWTPGAMDDVRDRLAEVCDAMGVARDAELALDWLRSVREEAPERVRESLAGIEHGIERTRRIGLAATARGVRDGTFQATIYKAADWADREANSPERLRSRSARTLFEETPRLLRRHARSIMRFDGTIVVSDVERIHELRRRCRRMRYAVEAGYTALGPGRRRLNRRLKAVQDALGDVHDADVHASLLPEAIDGETDRWLRERCAAERDIAWKDFRKAWPKLKRALRTSALRRVSSAV